MESYLRLPGAKGQKVTGQKRVAFLRGPNPAYSTLAPDTLTTSDQRVSSSRR